MGRPSAGSLSSTPGSPVLRKAGQPVRHSDVFTERADTQVYDNLLIVAKNMAVIYKAQKSSIANKEGQKLYYPRVILSGRVDTDQIAKEIAELSSLTPGDTKNVIDNLVTVMTRHLQASESVTLDGLGTFRFTLVATGKGAENEEDVTTGQSTLKVRFLPASTRHLDGSLATRSLVNGARFVRFDKVETPSAEPGTGEGEDDGDHQLG